MVGLVFGGQVIIKKAGQQISLTADAALRHQLDCATRGVRCFASAHGLEVVPLEVRGKGAAVRRILRQRALRGALPVYVGDDLSDEPAFRAVRKGVSVRVGFGRGTSAQYALRNPASVLAFLRLVEEVLR